MWPGYYIGKFDTLPEPILTEIPKLKVDPNVASGSYSTANCSAEVEDLPAGETVFRFFSHDEMHCILKGEAEITYSLAGTSHTEEKTVHVGSGDFYIVPLGARVTWKVASGSPLRMLWITSPGIPKPPYKHSEVSK